MKFFLFLVFVLLLFDENQGSTLPRKRTRRGLNTTLLTNFNGTYQRRNPCNNAEIESSSYAASHEFHHHTVEDNWTDYTSKCGAIINGFLNAIGNLFRFNSEQHGSFNFHINTSITHNQDGVCNKKTPCEAYPTITIEASNCEPCPKRVKAVVAIENKSAHSKCEDEEEVETYAVKSSEKCPNAPSSRKDQLSFSSSQNQREKTKSTFSRFPQDITTDSQREAFGPTTEYIPMTPEPPQQPPKDTGSFAFGYNENAELGPNTEETLPGNSFTTNDNFMGNQYQAFQKPIPDIEQPLGDQLPPNDFTPKEVQPADRVPYFGEQRDGIFDSVRRQEQVEIEEVNPMERIPTPPARSISPEVLPNSQMIPENQGFLFPNNNQVPPLGQVPIAPRPNMGYQRPDVNLSQNEQITNSRQQFEEPMPNFVPFAPNRNEAGFNPPNPTQPQSVPVSPVIKTMEIDSQSSDKSSDLGNAYDDARNDEPTFGQQNDFIPTDETLNEDDRFSVSSTPQFFPKAEQANTLSLSEPNNFEPQTPNFSRNQAPNVQNFQPERPSPPSEQPDSFQPTPPEMPRFPPNYPEYPNYDDSKVSNIDNAYDELNPPSNVANQPPLPPVQNPNLPENFVPNPRFRFPVNPNQPVPDATDFPNEAPQQFPDDREPNFNPQTFSDENQTTEAPESLDVTPFPPQLQTPPYEPIPNKFNNPTDNETPNVPDYLPPPENLPPREQFVNEQFNDQGTYPIEENTQPQFNSAQTSTRIEPPPVPQLGMGENFNQPTMNFGPNQEESFGPSNQQLSNSDFSADFDDRNFRGFPTPAINPRDNMPPLNEELRDKIEPNPEFLPGEFNVNPNMGPGFRPNQNGPEYQNWLRAQQTRPVPIPENLNEENEEEKLEMEKPWIPEPQEMNINENEREAEKFAPPPQKIQPFTFGQRQMGSSALEAESLISTLDNNQQPSATPPSNFQENQNIEPNPNPPFPQPPYPTQNQQSPQPPSERQPFLANIPQRPQPVYDNQIRAQQNRPFPQINRGNLPPFNRLPGRNNEMAPVPPPSQYQGPNRFPPQSFNPQNQFNSPVIPQEIVPPSEDINNQRIPMQPQPEPNTQPPAFDIVNEEPNPSELDQTQSRDKTTQVFDNQNENPPPEDYDYSMDEPSPPPQVNTEDVSPQYPQGPERRGFLPLIPGSTEPQGPIRTTTDSMELETEIRERGRKVPITLFQAQRPESFTDRNTQEIMDENINIKDNVKPDLDYLPEEQQQQQQQQQPQQPPIPAMTFNKQPPPGLNNRFTPYQQFPGKNFQNLGRNQQNIETRNFEQTENPAEETSEFPPPTQGPLNNEMMNQYQAPIAFPPDSLRAPPAFNRNQQPNFPSQEQIIEEEEMIANNPRFSQPQIAPQLTNRQSFNEEVQINQTPTAFPQDSLRAPPIFNRNQQPNISSEDQILEQEEITNNPRFPQPQIAPQFTNRQNFNEEEQINQAPTAFPPIFNRNQQPNIPPEDQIIEEEEITDNNPRFPQPPLDNRLTNRQSFNEEEQINQAPIAFPPIFNRNQQQNIPPKDQIIEEEEIIKINPRFPQARIEPQLTNRQNFNEEEQINQASVRFPQDSLRAPQPFNRNQQPNISSEDQILEEEEMIANNPKFPQPQIAPQLTNRQNFNEEEQINQTPIAFPPNSLRPSQMFNRNQQPNIPSEDQIFEEEKMIANNPRFPRPQIAPQLTNRQIFNEEEQINQTPIAFPPNSLRPSQMFNRNQQPNIPPEDQIIEEKEMIANNPRFPQPQIAPQLINRQNFNEEQINQTPTALPPNSLRPSQMFNRNQQPNIPSEDQSFEEEEIAANYPRFPQPQIEPQSTSRQNINEEQIEQAPTAFPPTFNRNQQPNIPPEDQIIEEEEMTANNPRFPQRQIAPQLINRQNFNEEEQIKQAPTVFPPNSLRPPQILDRNQQPNIPTEDQILEEEGITPFSPRFPQPQVEPQFTNRQNFNEEEQINQAPTALAQDSLRAAPVFNTNIPSEDQIFEEEEIAANNPRFPQAQIEPQLTSRQNINEEQIEQVPIAFSPNFNRNQQPNIPSEDQIIEQEEITANYPRFPQPQVEPQFTNRQNFNEEEQINQAFPQDSLRAPPVFDRNQQPDIPLEEEEITTDYSRLPQPQVEPQLINNQEQFMSDQAEFGSEPPQPQNSELYAGENRQELVLSDRQVPNAFPQFFQNERQTKPFQEFDRPPISLPNTQSDSKEVETPNPSENSKIKTTKVVEEFKTTDYPKRVNNPELPPSGLKDSRSFVEERDRVPNNQRMIFYPSKFNLQQVGPSLSNTVSLTNFELRKPEVKTPPELGFLVANRVPKPSPSEQLKQHSEKIVKALADKQIFEKQKTIFFEEKYSHAHPETGGTDVSLQGQNFQAVNARDAAFSDSHALVSDQTTPSNKPVFSDILTSRSSCRNCKKGGVYEYYRYKWENRWNRVIVFS